eukprot:TRINITY_DN8851_c0_g1_i1.p1 TRINITY_DN8851_c0_g1~~TRINITY_DN8851_c0_g1_i1.p1  ORF type:complete len:525 (-),score=52.54 TRINITY_DN8851_c0_g1_i1:114-1688(-)
MGSPSHWMLVSLVVIAIPKATTSVRVDSIHAIQLDSQRAGGYRGPPRIVTRCRFVQSYNFGDLVAEYYPYEECPPEIEQSWKCYFVCLQSSKTPAGVSMSGEAEFAGNQKGFLRSFTYRVDSDTERRREEGELVFFASERVDAAYIDVFKEFHDKSDTCESRGNFGALARQSHGKSMWRPDFSGLLHCARGGCVPGTGGWGSLGACSKSMWSVVNHIFHAAEGIEQAVVFLSLPPNSYAVASCKYEQQFEVGRRELVTRIVTMATLPRCLHIMLEEIWKCFEHCPGGKIGAAQLKDQKDVSDAFIRSDLVRHEVLSVEDKKASGPKSILRSITLHDSNTMSSREFVFRRGFPVDAEMWLQFIESLQNNPSTAAEAWSETKTNSRPRPKANTGGWTFLRNRETTGSSVVEHLAQSARWIGDASHSEISYVRFDSLVKSLRGALNNFEAGLGLPQTKVEPAHGKKYQVYLESLLRRIADRISQKPRNTSTTVTRKRKVAFSRATLQLTEARDELIFASQAAFGDFR